LFLVVK
jgi:transcriptional regulator with XRE-family HTH domain